jgi:NADH-quinone oxidoreductase subunit G
VSDRLFAGVPLYGGLTLEAIGGRGVRWPTLPGAASRLGELGAGAGAETLDSTDADGGGAVQPVPRSNALAAPGARLLLGTYRSIWAATEVEASPALKFLTRRQQVELSPVDAARLGLRHGEEVLVTCGDQQVRGRAELRAAVPEGRVFLEAGIDGPGGANALEGPLVSVHRATATNGAGASARARVQA